MTLKLPLWTALKCKCLTEYFISKPKTGKACKFTFRIETVSVKTQKCVGIMSDPLLYRSLSLATCLWLPRCLGRWCIRCGSTTVAPTQTTSSPSTWCSEWPRFSWSLTSCLLRPSGSFTSNMGSKIYSQTHRTAKLHAQRGWRSNSISKTYFTFRIIPWRVEPP